MGQVHGGICEIGLLDKPVIRLFPVDIVFYFIHFLAFTLMRNTLTFNDHRIINSL